LVLTALPTAFRLYFSQQQLDGIGDLHHFVDAKSELERKDQRSKLREETSKIQNALKEKVRIERQLQSNKKNTEQLHKKLCDLTADASSMLKEITPRNSSVLNGFKDAIVH